MLGRFATLIGAGALAFGGLAAVVPTPAIAAVITVTSTADDGGTGTLRYAIETAAIDPGGDTVVLEAGATYQLGCAEGGDLEHSTTPLVIDGNGATIEQTCDGYRALTAGSELELRDVTITGGDLDGPGGGVYAGGATTIRRSTIRGNSAGANLSGGGVYASTDITIVDSTIAGNTARNGGGLFVRGSATIVNSTFTGNGATGGGEGAGIGGAVESDSETSLEIAYSTFVGNVAGSLGDGVYVGEDATATFFANIVADNDCYTGNVGTSVTDEGYNVADATAMLTCKFSETTDVETSDVMLGPLASNGGPTQTMLPASASPAIDVVPDAECQTAPATGVTTDQRSLARPGVAGGACDSGAVEVQPPAPVPAPVELEPAFTG